MARPLRIEFAGALYHITSRGDRRETIYECDEDRIEFLELLEEAAERHNWLVHAYCLMSNHYHALVETVDGGLSRGMRHLNGVYTQRYNRRHGVVGHLFQGRYKAILVQREAYLLELARYIVLNPVRAGMVPDAGDWYWSSYAATAGLSSPHGCLTIDWILAAFDMRRGSAELAYRDFVSAGVGLEPIWSSLRNQVFLGDEAFVEHHLSNSVNGKNRSLAEVPRRQRRVQPLTLAEIELCSGNPQETMRIAYETGAYTMAEIAEHFGVHYSTVSRTLKLGARCKT